MVNLKRKTASSNILARKRTKVLRSAAELPWKTISHAHETTGEGDDGILELEEVDDVEIVYENTESGRVATFHVCYYPLLWKECIQHAVRLKLRQKMGARA
jgi:ATP-dependent RNA helicase DDX24/MAK5